MTRLGRGAVSGACSGGDSHRAAERALGWPRRVDEAPGDPSHPGGSPAVVGPCFPASAGRPLISIGAFSSAFLGSHRAASCTRGRFGGVRPGMVGRVLVGRRVLTIDRAPQPANQARNRLRTLAAARLGPVRICAGLGTGSRDDPPSCSRPAVSWPCERRRRRRDSGRWSTWDAGLQFGRPAPSLINFVVAGCGGRPDASVGLRCRLAAALVVRSGGDGGSWVGGRVATPAGGFVRPPPRRPGS
jgi:hypothetical protein